MTMSITKGHTRFIPCSLHIDCKNVQKSALKSVKVQKTGKSILHMFAFSFLTGRVQARLTLLSLLRQLQIFAYFASPHRPSESLYLP